MIEPLTCLLLLSSCASAAEPAAPTVAIIQATYEREAQRTDSRHAQNLKIVSADCSGTVDGAEYRCWVSFTSTTDPAQALYYDVAAIAHADGGWVLKSDFCRR